MVVPTFGRLHAFYVIVMQILRPIDAEAERVVARAFPEERSVGVPLLLRLENELLSVVEGSEMHAVVGHVNRIGAVFLNGGVSNVRR